MPQFKVRDLMINVLPAGRRGQTPICRGVTLPNCVDFSYVDCAVTLCRNVTLCLPVSLVAACGADAGASCNACVTDGGVSTGGCQRTGGHIANSELGLEDLAALKQQLRQSIAQVEAQERALEENLRPQTLDEVQQLEEKLTAALSELAERKVELRRGGPDPKT